ncbi:hypothetical protein HPB50_020958 [Hyalomma asiaticum]|uniref:Uncharacterized protein n=1 Tax=Hyalomma asiaticum TaxID=266040 RepID=A0ACB7SWX1_HYAAI|nr:hypothetical protein HPB50_020958 [Hyalomma asiaticum]
MILVYLRVFAEKCGLLDFLKLFVFSLASRKPPGAAVPEDNLERAFVRRVGCSAPRWSRHLAVYWQDPACRGCCLQGRASSTSLRQSQGATQGRPRLARARSGEALLTDNELCTLPVQG